MCPSSEQELFIDGHLLLIIVLTFLSVRSPVQQTNELVDSVRSYSKQREARPGNHVAFDRMYQLPGVLPSEIRVKLAYCFASDSDVLPSILSLPFGTTVT